MSATIAGHPQVEIRACIHIGMMQGEEGDVFGGTVNFAARMVGAFKGAEIWLSDRAKDDIDKLGAAKYKQLGWERHDGVAKASRVCSGCGRCRRIRVDEGCSCVFGDSQLSKSLSQDKREPCHLKQEGAMLASTMKSFFKYRAPKAESEKKHFKKA